MAPGKPGARRLVSWTLNALHVRAERWTDRLIYERWTDELIYERWTDELIYERWTDKLIYERWTDSDKLIYER